MKEIKKKKIIKKSYKFCEYCGKKCIDAPREHEFDVFTGDQLLWIQCPEWKYGYRHSRWIKERVTNVES